MPTDTIPHAPWVLIIEDDAYINKAYYAKFTHEHIASAVALDGEEGMRMMKESPTPPSLVLLDLMMPKKNGFEVLAEMHADPHLSAIPVIVLTNLGQEADARRGVEMGAKEYLVKSDTRIDDIVAKVKMYITAEGSTPAMTNK